ncbi:MAG TPA: sigma-70 family RNA polymerase sigma factor [Terriglobales bacterium]|nr:sigma-70 family RNA polymerase sigma factor [Terriglobales bacterium]
MPQARIAARRQQQEALRAKETQLQTLASQHNREEFFRQITPFLRPLKSYIKRRLRVAYLTLDVRTPVYTSGDILDSVVLKAYENYDKKPPELTLEQWLYQLANEIVDGYVRQRKVTDARRSSLETLEQKERRDLEEIPFWPDAEGEPYLLEDLDDSEYHLADFLPVRPPTNYQPDPEQELERAEEISQIVDILSRMPEQDRIVFELYCMEGFSKEEVAKITRVPVNEVPRIAEQVRQQVLQQIQGNAQKKAS